MYANILCVCIYIYVYRDWGGSVFLAVANSPRRRLLREKLAQEALGVPKN